jgi:hypothetical protein
MHYLTQNILAQTLHEDAYERNPRLKRFIKDSQLTIHSHPEFKKSDLDDRGIIYRELAERIWDPTQLLIDASA